MKKAIIGVLVALVLVSLSIYSYSHEDKYEYYDLNNNFGTSKKCKAENEELVCRKGKSWIKVHQYSLMVK